MELRKKPRALGCPSNIISSGCYDTSMAILVRVSGRGTVDVDVFRLNSEAIKMVSSLLA